SIFFFQAEDGIRDRTVTGVQTCALPISDRSTIEGDSRGRVAAKRRGRRADADPGVSARRAWIPAVAVLAIVYLATMAPGVTFWRSEERRVGKECRGGRWVGD